MEKLTDERIKEISTRLTATDHYTYWISKVIYCKSFNPEAVDYAKNDVQEINIVISSLLAEVMRSQKEAALFKIKYEAMIQLHELSESQLRKLQAKVDQLNKKCPHIIKG